VCAVLDSWISILLAQEREKRESSGEWGGGYRKYQIKMNGSPVGQSDCTGHTPGKKQWKKKIVPSSPIHHIVLLAALYPKTFQQKAHSQKFGGFPFGI
jgi:hypothetical protein